MEASRDSAEGHNEESSVYKIIHEGNFEFLFIVAFDLMGLPGLNRRWKYLKQDVEADHLDENRRAVRVRNNWKSSLTQLCHLTKRSERKFYEFCKSLGASVENLVIFSPSCLSTDFLPGSNHL
ncbi:uncharacterized protein [Venturia canescens]|uniref:uncharacterized protein n=1 Tax=Venturia canescens TaxID=32260 RepID=UPI001C9C1795|nr:uncharacterized protein LOC122415096 [Venturia canescens]